VGDRPIPPWRGRGVAAGGGLVGAASLPIAGAATPLGWTDGQEVVQVKVGVPGVPLAWNPNVVDPPAGITPL